MSHQRLARINCSLLQWNTGWAIKEEMVDRAQTDVVVNGTKMSRRRRKRGEGELEGRNEQRPG